MGIEIRPQTITKTNGRFVKGDPRITGKKQSQAHIEKRIAPLRMLRPRVEVSCDFCGAKKQIIPSGKSRHK